MAEVLHGNAGGNRLNARADKTQVYGLAGNDTLTSDGYSNVLLVGGSGNDSLVVTGGNVTLAGGAGRDTFVFNYANNATGSVAAVIQDFDPSEDKLVVNYTGTGTASLASVTSGNFIVPGSGSVNTTDLIWRDTVQGGFRVTLKSARENDYFDGTAPDEAWDVLKLTNQERENLNLSPLTVSDGLTKAASVRAQEITEILSHTRPDGTNCFTVFDEVGKTYWAYGENIAAGQIRPQAS